MASKRILVVEDDPIGREAIADFLTAHGYAVQVATNGVEALDLWRRERPDLILADVLLPRKSGFEVCFEVKRTEAGQNVPQAKPLVARSRYLSPSFRVMPA